MVIDVLIVVEVDGDLEQFAGELERTHEPAGSVIVADGRSSIKADVEAW